MNDLARLVEGLALYRDKITVAIDAVAALLPAPPAESAPAMKRLVGATNGKRKVRRVKAKAPKAAENGKRPRLNDEQRAAIRKALATEKIGAVCARFGVSYPTVKKIRDEMGAPSAPPQPRVVEPAPSNGPKLRCSFCGRIGTHPKQCESCKNARF
jgi:primosomal protein N'